MSQKDFLREFDALATDAFLDAGIADAGTYTAPAAVDPDAPAPDPVAVDVLVDRDLRDFEDAERFIPIGTPFVVVTFQRRQIEPVKGALLAIGDETFKLEKPIREDESMARWVVVNA